MSAEPIIKALDQYAILQGSLARLSARVRAEAVAAVTWTLPDPMDTDREAQDFKESAASQHQAIAVRELSGEAAIAKAASVYKRIIRWAQQSPSHTIRTAGVVAVPSPDIADLVDEVNRCKDAFREAMESIHARSQVRRQMIDGTALKDVQQLQAFRHILVLREMPARIGFTWEGQHRTVQSINAGMLRERIVEKYQHLGKWEEALRDYRDDARLAIVKHKSPTPAANIRSSDGVVKKPALLPYIVVGAELPVLTPLGDFKGRERPAEGLRGYPTLVASQPLIPELRVYAYQQIDGVAV